MMPRPPCWAMAIAMAGLGHRVHGRREQRDAELDLAGQPGADVGLGRQDLGIGGLEQHVVEGERLSDRHRRPLHR